ncbi:MAG: HU family DNA-binding protein [Nitrospinae bacterium]|nr:HU family DNA-binding protein [Nitrospinota bacterium]
MNKTDLVDRIAQEAGITKKQAKDAFEAVTGGITESLGKGESVTIIGFGTFSVKQRAARTGINPQTKAKMKIAAKKVPKFTAGAGLKGAV